MINFFTEDLDFVLYEEKKIKNWILHVATNESKSLGDISFILCSDNYLLKVNQDYLNHDYYTDIITFDYCEDTTISGDIFISIDRVLDNANLLKVDFVNELHRVIIHGILHLCGYKDKTEKEALLMRQMEDKSLSLRNFNS